LNADRVLQRTPVASPVSIKVTVLDLMIEQ